MAQRLERRAEEVAKTGINMMRKGGLTGVVPINDSNIPVYHRIYADWSNILEITYQGRTLKPVSFAVAVIVPRDGSWAT